MFQNIILKENGVSVSKTRQILIGEREKREQEMGEALKWKELFPFNCVASEIAPISNLQL